MGMQEELLNALLKRSDQDDKLKKEAETCGLTKELEQARAEVIEKYPSQLELYTYAMDEFREGVGAPGKLFITILRSMPQSMASVLFADMNIILTGFTRACKRATGEINDELSEDYQSPSA